MSDTEERARIVSVLTATATAVEALSASCRHEVEKRSAGDTERAVWIGKALAYTDAAYLIQQRAADIETS